MIGDGGGHQRMVEALLASPEPSVRWKVRVGVLGEPADCDGIVSLREEIRDSVRVRRLLTAFSSRPWPDAYAKWQGAHWVLAALADVGYPPGDPALYPLREQVLDAWLDEVFYREFNHPRAVAPATYVRVLRVIDELGFVPNGSARQLRLGRGNVIGLVVIDLGNPFFTDVARGVLCQ